MSRSKWQQYLKKPFSGHAEYKSQLERIQKKYPKEMRRRDGAGKKKRSVKAILKAGASERHYRYLFNNAIFASLGSKTAGTMVNEATHKQIKNWGASVTQQHADRMICVGKVFGLYKLLGRRRPETKVPESRILSLVAGRIASEGLSALWPIGQSPPAATRPPRVLDADRRKPMKAWRDEQRLREARKRKTRGQSAASNTRGARARKLR